MTTPKLTEAQRLALTALSDNQEHPISNGTRGVYVGSRVMASLVRMKLASIKVRPLVWHVGPRAHITDAGRAALGEP